MSTTTKKLRSPREGTHWTSIGFNRTKVHTAPGEVTHEQLHKDIDRGFRFFWASRGMYNVALKPEFVPRY